MWWISHIPTFEEQIGVVEKTLFEIDETAKPTILVFNKIDAFSHVVKDDDDLSPKKRENYTLDELKLTWLSRIKENCIFISAKEKENIEDLKQLIYDKVREIHITRFPYNDFLYQTYEEEE